MKKDEVILFTSGSGQYFHVEAVTVCARDFTDAEAEEFRTFDNRLRDRSEVCFFVREMAARGLIKTAIGYQFSHDQTNRGVVHIGPIPNPLACFENAYVKGS